KASTTPWSRARARTRRTRSAAVSWAAARAASGSAACASSARTWLASSRIQLSVIAARVGGGGGPSSGARIGAIAGVPPDGYGESLLIAPAGGDPGGVV